MEYPKSFFAQNLNRFLEEKKKTQQELADFLKIGRGTVNHWTKGRNEPKKTDDKIQKICVFLGVTYDELYANPNQQKKDDFKAHFFEGYDYDKLPEAKKEKIRQLIKLVLED